MVTSDVLLTLRCSTPATPSIQQLIVTTIRRDLPSNDKAIFSKLVDEATLILLKRVWGKRKEVDTVGMTPENLGIYARMSVLRLLHTALFGLSR